MSNRFLSRIIGGIASAAVCATAFPASLPVQAAGSYDYSRALADSLYFFDENACGSDVGGLGISWRGNCHTYDGTALISQADGFPASYTSLIDPDGDGRVDVSGGYHDAGDHVKFNVTMGFAGSSLAMSDYLFPGAYEKAGCRDHLVKILKRNADYLMKTTYLDGNGAVVAVCHVVADGNVDHSNWSSPEKQTYERKTYWLNADSNNSVVCCEMAAALAGTAYVVRDTDAVYAAECVKYAKALVSFATAHPGNEGRGNGSFYGTADQYQDELALAQCWLWILGEGERPAFQPTGGGGYNNQYYDCYLYCWDKVWQGYSAMMYRKTQESAFAEELRFELNNKGGLSENSYNTLGITWGVSRANCAFQMDALVLAGGNADSADAKAAKYQMDYLLGDNDYGYSFLIGFGERYPSHIHHRAANPNEGEASYVLRGALIGGPDGNGYADNTSSYQYTEPALDYNGCFALACAGLVELYGDTIAPSGETPSVTPSITPTGEDPTGTPTEIPSTTPTGEPGGNPSVTPTETPGTTPGETPSATPTEGLGEDPSVTPAETPGTTPEETPGTTPTEGPVEEPSVTPAANPTEPSTGTPTPVPTESNYSDIELKPGEDGAYYAYRNREVATDLNGFVDWDGSKFFLVNGKVDTAANGLVQDLINLSDWYFCSMGQVQTQYTGLAEYNGEWFYVKNGKLDTKMAAYVSYDGGLFFVGAGRIMTEVNGLAKDPNGSDWFYLANGQAQIQYTGLAQYDGEWFYVIAGRFAQEYTGEVEYHGAFFRV
ncbi:MAG: glycoside hydrolase family 9 protein, partial [Lachnospiraceae bacterium]|nr:glycoside hydrolase family 9 protein [Lachnospiraceae bacterium]